MEACGFQLYCNGNGEPVPLKSVFFNVDIHAARTCAITMTQTYENLSERGADVTFYYPVDLSFAMSKIHMEFADVDDPTSVIVIETSMEPKDQAQKKYDQIKKEGKEIAVLATHAMVDNKSMIKIQLGNFPPNSRAKLTCHMFGELTYNSAMQAFNFRLPLTYVPKYLLSSNNKAQIGDGRATSWDIVVNVHKASTVLSEVISHTHLITL